jgi:hypothetical protein
MAFIVSSVPRRRIMARVLERVKDGRLIICWRDLAT